MIISLTYGQTTPTVLLSDCKEQLLVMERMTIGVGPTFEAQAWTRDDEWGRTDESFQQITEDRQYISAQEDTILFARLVAQWHQERGATSSLSEMILCPSYQRIIGMGAKALPLILARMEYEQDDPDHWSAALEAITGDDPVPKDAYGDTVKTAEAWFAWAEKNNVWSGVVR